MLDIDEQQKKWGEQTKRGYLKWPDENVIKFMNKSFRENRNNIKVLDLGCGSGRNTVALAEEGFQVYACDYSKDCVEITKKRCEKIKAPKVEIKQNSNIDIPIEDDMLDSVVACGSLFYNNLQNRKVMMNNIIRVLKKGGIFWSNWRTIEDSMYNKGKEIEKNFYILDDDGREGLAYYFATIEELKQLYSYAGFKIYNIEKLEISMNNLKEKSSWYNIFAKKI
ncbi:class I SAM-dependent methyltransferase [Clostridium sporogenes]|uniref:class I SAM-dependent methyltransferase n=1 Tax=Clostridium TaxID=1485 RepID=UPI0013D10D20|nr:class I SAM-dependent methyltransferase [Clostridium sporogenes]EJP6470955.1 class I SAM-dependent methyltransferase [Clostridium botulinum]NFV12944.1 class I SAM-dependent methyltransferase [Clostridium sporogenes]